MLLLPDRLWLTETQNWSQLQDLVQVVTSAEALRSTIIPKSRLLA